MTSVVNEVQWSLKRHKAYQSKRWLVAYSGGPDSAVLLDVLVRLRPQGTKIVAIHVNHGLSPYAHDWESVAEQVCAQYEDVDLVVKRVYCEVPGLSIEEAARNARYAVFEGHLAAGELLFMGHHLNDQAETFLFRLFRGTGLPGMAGMPEARPLGVGKLVRPLLRVERKAIEAYVEQSELRVVEDESNLDPVYSRNEIRLNILPRILKRWPKALQAFQHEMGHVSEALELIAEVAEDDYLNIQMPHPRQDTACSISVDSIKRLSFARGKQVLHYMANLKQPGCNVRGRMDEVWVSFVSQANTSKVKGIDCKGIVFKTNGRQIWIDCDARELHLRS